MHSRIPLVPVELGGPLASMELHQDCTTTDHRPPPVATSRSEVAPLSSTNNSSTTVSPPTHSSTPPLASTPRTQSHSTPSSSSWIWSNEGVDIFLVFQ
ncbi:hypothetical protein L1987_19143 [Smallanthus sonchifolius]|uniref:Uncharacterized protein n=1 Tax=Smallanthus sonchifolius TaxID=185202 RepID=A0ACB9J1I2_9ASTR|nr:hypothetical protein L1987_19143 [Smallanthus sonchifolius]